MSGKHPDELIERVCELRAKHVLGEERWTYPAIEERTGMSQGSISRYLSRAGLTDSTPETERVRHAKRILGRPIGEGGERAEGNGPSGTSSSSSTRNPGERTSSGSSPPSSEDPSSSTQDPTSPSGGSESGEDWSMPLDEGGAEGFVPESSSSQVPPSRDSSTRERGPRSESPESPERSQRGSSESPESSRTGGRESHDGGVESRENVAFGYECGSCERPYGVLYEDLGSVIECPYDDCSQQAKVPTEAQLIQRGVVLE